MIREELFKETATLTHAETERQKEFHLRKPTAAGELSVSAFAAAGCKFVATNFAARK